MTVTSCTNYPLHSTMELYERCGYPNHEQHGTNLFNQCPIITVGAILLTHEKQTSETQAVKDPIGTSERE